MSGIIILYIMKLPAGSRLSHTDTDRRVLMLLVIVAAVCKCMCTRLFVYTAQSLLQRRLHSYNEQDLKGDPPVQVPVLDSDGHQQPTEKEHVGVFQVLGTNLSERRK